MGRLRSLIFCLCHLFALLAANCLAAESATPTRANPAIILGPTDFALTAEFAKELRAIDSHARDIQVWDAARLAQSDGSQARVWLAIGEDSLRSLLGRRVEGVIVALFVSNSGYQQVLAEYPSRKQALTAIYYNPPLDRQFALGQLLLSSARNAAVLTSQQHFDLSAQLNGKLQDAKTISIYHLQQPEELPKELKNALQNNDFILGTLDPEIYNKNLIKHILLTAYRHNKVLIGPTRAYVHAGALASTYSTVADIARQTDTLLTNFDRSGSLPTPQYPRYFAIAINEQVARSLNLVIPDMNDIQQKLNALEGH